jgi:hypothetical protein
MYKSFTPPNSTISISRVVVIHLTQPYAAGTDVNFFFFFFFNIPSLALNYHLTHLSGLVIPNHC